MQKSGDNVPCPHENRIRISDLLFVSTLLFVTEVTKNALSLRITVIVRAGLKGRGARANFYRRAPMT